MKKIGVRIVEMNSNETKGLLRKAKGFLGRFNNREKNSHSQQIFEIFVSFVVS